MNIENILKQRKKTHGDFSMQAIMSQKLKDTFYEYLVTDPNEMQKEAIEMILHKIARIGSGDCNFIDSWKDIVGYSQLIVNELHNTPGSTDVDCQKMECCVNEDGIVYWKEKEDK